MIITEHVVLVDEQDREIGTAEKIEAHQNNWLHRAFSIFIFHQQSKKLLLQQRAQHKYHSAGLWTNTCCSHPRQHEDLITAGKRRLAEELGFSTELTDVGWFHYNVHFSNGLTENEIDHVLIGKIDDTTHLIANPDEVQATRWISLEDLRAELSANPAHFTPWLKMALEVVSSRCTSI